jgi:hypothetical protein
MSDMTLLFEKRIPRFDRASVEYNDYANDLQKLPVKTQKFTAVSGYFFFFYGPTALVGIGRFVSSLIYTQPVGLLGRVSSPLQDRYLTQTDIYASSGIRTHDPSV